MLLTKMPMQARQVLNVALPIRWIAIPIAIAMMAWVSSIALGQNNALYTSRNPEPKPQLLTLALKPAADISANLIQLRDIATITGPPEMVRRLADIPLAPTPALGNRQSWTREDIEKALELRGISERAFQWAGAASCTVQRVNAPARPSQPVEADVTDASLLTSRDSSQVVTASALGPSMKGAEQPNTIPKSGLGKKNQNKIDRTKFTPAFTSPANLTQAERVAISAIENYLQTKTMADAQWVIKATVPPEHAQTFLQRRQILGVAGGLPPWDGDQEFQFLIDGPMGESAITIKANIQLPEMVIAANRPLAKGYVLHESDLVWATIPKGSSYGVEACFTDLQQLIGKQLRRSMSTQQIIKLTEVGPPTIVRAGDFVQVSVIAGPLVVNTGARAVESGGLDDLIPVEVLPSRKRIFARVVSEHMVEVISNGMPTNSQPPSTNSISTPSKPGS